MENSWNIKMPYYLWTWTSWNCDGVLCTSNSYPSITLYPYGNVNKELFGDPYPFMAYSIRKYKQWLLCVSDPYPCMAYSIRKYKQWLLCFSDPYPFMAYSIWKYKQWLLCVSDPYPVMATPYGSVSYFIHSVVFGCPQTPRQFIVVLWCTLKVMNSVRDMIYYISRNRKQNWADNSCDG